MTQHTDAADAIRRIARLFEPLMKAADVLEESGSFEQAANEAKARAEAAQAERDEILGKLAEASTTLGQLEPKVREAQEALGRAQQEAADTVAKADTQARQMVAKAEEQAAQKQADATREADRVMAEAKRTADAMVTTALEEVVRAEAARDTALREEREARERIAAERARIQAALG